MLGIIFRFLFFFLCNSGTNTPVNAPIVYPRITSERKCFPDWILKYPTAAGIIAAPAHTKGFALESGKKSLKTFAAKNVAVADAAA